jgi:hypothetical protein
LRQLNPNGTIGTDKGTYFNFVQEIVSALSNHFFRHFHPAEDSRSSNEIFAFLRQLGRSFQVPGTF